MNERDVLSVLTEAVSRMQNVMDRRYGMIELNGRHVLVERMIQEGPMERPRVDPRVDSSTYETFFSSEIKYETPKHEDCLIMCEPIQPGDLYHKCAECSQSISTVGMSGWWNTCTQANKSVSCPACRTKWKDTSLYLYSIQ